MKIEWAEPPPGRLAGWQGEYAAELRRNPGRWAKWPRTYDNASAPSAVRHNIMNKTAKTPVAFREGIWEAVVRNGVLYVRYMGEEPASVHDLPEGYVFKHDDDPVYEAASHRAEMDE